MKLFSYIELKQWKEEDKNPKSQSCSQLLWNIFFPKIELVTVFLRK